MTVVLVVLTFAIFILIGYFRNRKRMTVTAPKMQESGKPVTQAQSEYVCDFRLPAHFQYHPGHTWALRESPTLVRVGIDDLAGRFIGPAEEILLPKRGTWIRQGQKIFTVLKNGSKVELVSPIEGEVTTINEAVAKDPSLPGTDPYGKGWLLTVVSPDAETNFRNLLSGNLARQWMTEAANRLRANLPALTGAVAQDGGTARGDLSVQLGDQTWSELARELFLI